VSDGNGNLPALTAEDLADESRFQFRRKEVEVPEIGGKVTLKTLSVAEREALPPLVGEDDEKESEANKRLAKALSLIMVEPNVTPEQAEAFLGRWPAGAWDRIVVAYLELATGQPDADEKKEDRVARGTFPEEG
jgi:hypothetical protein